MVRESRTRAHLEQVWIERGGDVRVVTTKRGNEYVSVVQFAQKSGLLKGFKITSRRQERGRGSTQFRLPL